MIVAAISRIEDSMIHSLCQRNIAAVYLFTSGPAMDKKQIYLILYLLNLFN